MELGTGYVAAFGTVTILAMLLAHRLVRRVLSPSASPRAELLGDNRAQALRETGDVLAVFLVGGSIVKFCVHGEGIATDAMWCAAYAALGLLLLELTGHFGLRLLFDRRLKDSLERGNVAAGTAAAAHYVATGILVSRAVAGSDLRGLGLSLAFFTLAQIVHQLLVAAFRLLTTYDDAEQIEGENLAAAISYAGVTLSIAMIVARALEGDFPGWWNAISGFGLLSATALGLYPVRQLLVQSLVLGGRPSLRGGDLDVAISRDRNVGVAALEATSYIGMAVAIVTLA